MKIVYVNYGLATYYPTHIELNNGFKNPKWQKLKQVILKHELAHRREGIKRDFKDFWRLYRHNFEVMLFTFENPSVLSTLIPYDKHFLPLLKECLRHVYWFDVLMYAYLIVLVLTSTILNPLKFLT